MLLRLLLGLQGRVPLTRWLLLLLLRFELLHATLPKRMVVVSRLAD
jgi:hypothetical protein